MEEVLAQLNPKLRKTIMIEFFKFATSGFWTFVGVCFLIAMLSEFVYRIISTVVKAFKK